ncbi:hypothetical protein SCA6_000379 [Theobroma cacao]
MGPDSFLLFYIPNTATFLTTLFLTVLGSLTVVAISHLLCHVHASHNPNCKVYLFHLAYFGACYCFWVLVIGSLFISVAENKEG